MLVLINLHRNNYYLLHVVIQNAISKFPETALAGVRFRYLFISIQILLILKAVLTMLMTYIPFLKGAHLGIIEKWLTNKEFCFSLYTKIYILTQYLIHRVVWIVISAIVFWRRLLK